MTINKRNLLHGLVGLGLAGAATLLTFALKELTSGDVNLGPLGTAAAIGVLGVLASVVRDALAQQSGDGRAPSRSAAPDEPKR